jgi:Protein of unknown function (DUF4233)
MNASGEHESAPARTALGGKPSGLPDPSSLGGKPSGLPNPSRALRGLGSVALILEAIVLLLAIQPIRITEGAITEPQLVALLGSAVVAILLTGLLRSRWGWWLAGGLQAVLIAGGLLHWMIGAVGVLFGLVWLYVLFVRRRVLM